MRNVLSVLVAVAGLSLMSSAAQAHVSVLTPTPAIAKTTYETAFSVGHGCEGADTYSVQVRIPAGITAVRAVDSNFGKATILKDAGGLVTSVTWTRASDAELSKEDDRYYKLTLRIGLPDAPFTTLYFPTTQTCRKPDGTILPAVEWVGMGGAGHDATDAGPAPEPAPALFLYPARFAGWNKYTVPAAITDLSVFKDAQIVWAGNAAYSANPATVAQIQGEAATGTTLLQSIPANTEIWVKY